MTNYLLASNKQWHIDFFMAHRKSLPGNWSIVTCESDLADQVVKTNPRYAFFPHWSYIVPAEIYNATECVCFHMTDVPYGRGGSPLQNLIVRGKTDTKITALRMTEALDAGPVYLKRDLQLSGSALEIYKRTAPICFGMMQEIVLEGPMPIDQTGRPTNFKRRLPVDSEINKMQSLNAIYDHIRMLDAPGYPTAFLVYNGMKIDFTEAKLSAINEIEAKVRITKYEE